MPEDQRRQLEPKVARKGTARSFSAMSGRGAEENRLIRFGRAICGDLVQAERREWWLANGRAAYAAGTIAGSLTRRYHGLLIAPVDPPLGRRLVWAKADAELVEGERSWPLLLFGWRRMAAARPLGPEPTTTTSAS